MKTFDGRAVIAKAARVAPLAMLFALALAPLAIAADPHVSVPTPWQLGMQEAATSVREQIDSLYGLVSYIITGIVLLVFGLLGYVILRFNARANPVPSRNAHNTLIEVIWTVIPVLILVIIAIPSFKLLFFEDKAQKSDLTVKVTGHQWYWSYEYPDLGGVAFDSSLVPSDYLKPGQTRLLDVDNRMVVPVGANIRVQVAGSDVMHSWFVPSFGVQMYAVPGHLNETWFNVKKEGVYYGQCNQICGVNHAYMPIVVEAVSQEEFDKWVASKKSASSGGATPAQSAAAPASEVTTASALASMSAPAPESAAQ